MISAHALSSTPGGSVWDVSCSGHCQHKSAEECARGTHLVFPYRGVFLRHVGRDDAVADANQVLFFNDGQDYRISHPVSGGDACLSLAISPPLLLELAPTALLHDRAVPTFKHQHQRIDARAQVLVALLRHALRNHIADALEADILTLTLVRRALGLRTTRGLPVSTGRQRLVDRVKLVLTADPGRRWTLADIATETGGSPVYLTQVFQQVEGMPLYRYQTQLRLARALDLIDRYDDLTTLGLDLGFSSHSHFSAAFRRAYGRTPSQFKQAALHR